jgi:hypothetical protein
MESGGATAIVVLAVVIPMYDSERVACNEDFGDNILLWMVIQNDVLYNACYDGGAPVGAKRICDSDGNAILRKLTDLCDIARGADRAFDIKIYRKCFLVCRDDRGCDWFDRCSFSKTVFEENRQRNLVYNEGIHN